MTADRDDRREDTDAFQRIYGEAVHGAEFAFADGTVKIGDRVVKVGPRAILDEAGRLVGFRPEPDPGPQDRF